jgi:hypothetical protein
MSHLTEKLAEFVFGELSPSEMADAKRHLADCPACRTHLDEFQQTYAMLKASPDTEPPRRIIFEIEKQSFAPWIWRWIGPMAASAAVALAVVQLSPVREPQIVERVVQQPAAGPPAVQPVDFRIVIDELQATQREWLAGELRKRDAEISKEFVRVRGEQDSLYIYQRRTDRDNAELQASIQPLLVSRNETRE